MSKFGAGVCTRREWPDSVCALSGRRSSRSLLISNLRGFSAQQESDWTQWDIPTEAKARHDHCVPRHGDVSSRRVLFRLLALNAG